MEETSYECNKCKWKNGQIKDIPALCWNNLLRKLLGKWFLYVRVTMSERLITSSLKCIWGMFPKRSSRIATLSKLRVSINWPACWTSWLPFLFLFGLKPVLAFSNTVSWQQKILIIITNQGFSRTHAQKNFRRTLVTFIWRATAKKFISFYIF